MSGLRVLVCPLDWGLGHATRCVPIVRALRDAGHEVFLGVSGKAASALLREEFPSLEQMELPAYDIRYPLYGWQMPWWLLRKIPDLAWVIRAEQKAVRDAVRSRGIQVLISDNRFGCWDRDAFCVYMTHQVRIAFPGPLRFFERIGVCAHAWLYRHFQRIWIPDIPRYPGLAGKLSHETVSLPVDWLGPLSRLSRSDAVEHLEVLAIVSGPEPHRSAFEDFALTIANRRRGKSVIVRGLPHQAESAPQRCGETVLYPHASSGDLARWILGAETIICRSGYSTVMDLAVLGRHAQWYPTPGQTEQEYLAELHHENLPKLLDSDFQLLNQAVESLPGHYRRWKMRYA